MAMVKDAAMTMSDLVQRGQAFIESGRDTLDLLDELLTLLQEHSLPEGEEAGKVGATAPDVAETEEQVQEVESKAQETNRKTITQEEVRAVMVNNSRRGYRAEMKALVAAYGVKNLSDLTDPEKLEAILEEAKTIGGTV